MSFFTFPAGKGLTAALGVLFASSILGCAWAGDGERREALSLKPVAESVAGHYGHLDRLIALALQKHPSIASARAELGATQSEIASARNQYLPTPSLQMQQETGETATVLTLQQPLWTGGRLDAGLAVAKSRADAAQASIADAQYGLALRVTAAWAAWMQARGRIEALAEGIDLLNVYTESVSRRIRGGSSAEVDRELVAARLAQTQGDLAAARAAERSALAQLSQMVGQPLRSEDLATGMADAAEVPLPALDALIEQAVARSAALKRLEADLEASRRGTDKKRAALLPSVSLRAQREHGGTPANGIAANDSRVMLVLEYAPGAGFSAGTEVEAAVAREEGLRERREAAKAELIEKVSTDYEEHRASLERQREARRTATASAEVLASYDRLFVAGKRSWLDVINAARELIQARTALTDVEAQRLATRARLRLHAWEMFGTP